MRYTKRWLFLVIAVCLLALTSSCAPAAPDNETPAQDRITHEYHQEDFYAAQAVYGVRTAFHDVYAKDLAKEYDFSLECKRTIRDDLFYYLLLGNGYQCYFFVDTEDIVQEVLVIDAFPSEKDVREMISACSAMDIPFPAGYDIASCELPLKTENGFVYTEFILQDGVLVVKSPWTPATQGEPQEFSFYSDEEWASICEDWNGYAILQIDKELLAS